MSISIASSVNLRGAARGLVPLCAGAGAYLFFLCVGEILLRDTDSLWQIRVGQWIIDHGAMPFTDVFSFTRLGEPWMSSSWLSQVLLALAYGASDWAGPVILSSLAIAALVAILVHLLSAYFDPPRTILIAILALLQSTFHFLARPHLLALPVMLAFVGGLMMAADRRSHPSWLLLPLMALWANLHGSFVLGLALIGPIGLEAIWCAEPRRRFGLIVRWGLFGLAAVAASCLTPYGWNTLFTAARILNMGQLLSRIWEWMPADFSHLSFFEATLLAMIGLVFHRRLELSPPRIILLVGLIWMALTHVRNIEVFAFVAPLVLAKPIAEQWMASETQALRPGEPRALPYVTLVAAIIVAVAGWASTTIYVGHHPIVFDRHLAPVAAVDFLKQRGAERIFSTTPFGNYLVSRDIKTFIDGRSELYGEKFVLDQADAIDAHNVDDLLRMLDDYRIDATLLYPTSPAAIALDHIGTWKRIYADDAAVIHVRTDLRTHAAPAAKAAD